MSEEMIEKEDMMAKDVAMNEVTAENEGRDVTLYCKYNNSYLLNELTTFNVNIYGKEELIEIRNSIKN